MRTVLQTELRSSGLRIACCIRGQTVGSRGADEVLLLLLLRAVAPTRVRSAASGKRTVSCGMGDGAGGSGGAVALSPRKSTRGTRRAAASPHTGRGVEEGGGSLGGRRQIRRPRARLASPGYCGATGEGAAGAGRRPPLRRRLRARGEGPPARERSSGRGAPSTVGRKPRERRGGGGRREAGYDGAVVPAADAARREKSQKNPGMQHPFGLHSFCRTGCGNRWRRKSALRFFNLQMQHRRGWPLESV
jgi:hypothetical protein